jgi:Holliday junction DNA helicase RuvB
MIMSYQLPHFQGFVGNRRVVRLLQTQLAGALARGETLPPTLIFGPSGVGKNALAEALAKAAKKKMILLNGRVIAAELAKQFIGAESGDFLFIDEAHSLTVEAQQLLFEVIDYQRVPSFRTTHTASTQENSADYVNIKTVNLVLATDQPGKLVNALIRRLAIRVELRFYTLKDMRAICDHIMAQLNLLCTGQVRNRIARLCKGLPRNAKHLLQGLRRHFPDAESRKLGMEELRQFMADSGIDPHGLDVTDRGYLKLLAAGKRVSVEGLASQIGCDATYLRRQVEPSLLKLGLITIASSGRQITTRGEQWINRKIHTHTEATNA